MTKLKHILLCVILLVSSASASDVERMVVLREEPEYPPIAAKMNLHGTVKLKIWISPDGAVRRLEYIGGHPLLEMCIRDRTSPCPTHNVGKRGFRLRSVWTLSLIHI